MTDAIKQAWETVYQSLNSNNEGIDTAIADLKSALDANGQKVAIAEKSRLAQNDRPGRRLMQSYFKKRGVTVEFAE